MSGFLSKLTSGPQKAPVCSNTRNVEFCCSSSSCFRIYKSYSATCVKQVDATTGYNCSDYHVGSCGC
jgi:hypothetical protein